MLQLDLHLSAWVRQNVFVFEQFAQCVKVSVRILCSSDQQHLAPFTELCCCVFDFQLHVGNTSLSWNTGFLLVPSSLLKVPIRSSKHVTEERFFSKCTRSVWYSWGGERNWEGTRKNRVWKIKSTQWPKHFSKFLKEFHLVSFSRQMSKILYNTIFLSSGKQWTETGRILKAKSSDRKKNSYRNEHLRYGDTKQCNCTKTFYIFKCQN